jgi:predicted transcriptional regulator of viral defense system
MENKGLPDLLRYSSLDALGVTRYRLSALVQGGEYEQIAPGVFVRSRAIDDTTAAWIAINARRPDATLCLLSALAIHDLTDEIPAASDMALPRGAHKLAVQHAPIAWHFFDRETFEIGRTTHQLSNDLEIGIYGPERTIIDVFRLQHIWGFDLAAEALKRWLRHPGNSPGTLTDMANSFPAARRSLRFALEVLL